MGNHDLDVNEPERCPKCKSFWIYVQLLNWVETPPHSHDPNERRCDDCEHTWYRACPQCGWTYNGDQL